MGNIDRVFIHLADLEGKWLSYTLDRKRLSDVVKEFKISPENSCDRQTEHLE